MSVNPARTLCLGDALVDLVGERPSTGLTEIDRFSPTSAGRPPRGPRGGAGRRTVALAGGPATTSGDAGWRPAAEARIDVSLFKLLAGPQTPLAFVTVDPEGEPTYQLPAKPTARHGRADRGDG